MQITARCICPTRRAFGRDFMRRMEWIWNRIEMGTALNCRPWSRPNFKSFRWDNEHRNGLNWNAFADIQWVCRFRPGQSLVSTLQSRSIFVMQSSKIWQMWLIGRATASWVFSPSLEPSMPPKMTHFYTWRGKYRLSRATHLFAQSSTQLNCRLWSTSTLKSFRGGNNYGKRISSIAFAVIQGGCFWNLKERDLDSEEMLEPVKFLINMRQYSVLTTTNQYRSPDSDTK
jgi:hypothetical protein